MKTCTLCKEEKPLDDFGKNKRKKDGYHYRCKKCRSSEQRKATQARVRIIRRYKRFCGCMLCNEREPIALDLHHVNPATKDRNPSELAGYSMDRVRNEIRKCVVLCANCHRKVHAGLLKID